MGQTGGRLAFVILEASHKRHSCDSETEPDVKNTSRYLAILFRIYSQGILSMAEQHRFNNSTTPCTGR